MPVFKITFEIFCKECGAELTSSIKGGDEVQVEPCEVCLSRIYNEGYDEGRSVTKYIKGELR